MKKLYLMIQKNQQLTAIRDINKRDIKLTIFYLPSAQSYHLGHPKVYEPQSLVGLFNLC